MTPNLRKSSEATIGNRSNGRNGISNRVKKGLIIGECDGCGFTTQLHFHRGENYHDCWLCDLCQNSFIMSVRIDQNTFHILRSINYVGNAIIKAGNEVSR